MYYVMKPGISCFACIGQYEHYCEAKTLADHIGPSVVILKDTYEENQYGAPKYPFLSENEVHSD